MADENSSAPPAPTPLPAFNQGPYAYPSAPEAPRLGKLVPSRPAPRESL